MIQTAYLETINQTKQRITRFLNSRQSQRRIKTSVTRQSCCKPLLITYISKKEPFIDFKVKFFCYFVFFIRILKLLLRFIQFCSLY